MLKYLLQKEIIQIWRNRFIPRLIVVFPIMIMLVIPWVMNFEVRNVRVDIVDNIRSASSERLTHRIEASHYFIFNGLRMSYTQALDDIEHGRADLIVDMEKPQKPYCGGATPMLVAANAVDGQKGALGANYIMRIITQNNKETKRPNSRSAVMTPQHISINDAAIFLYNKNLSYKRFMIPALMTIIIMMLCGFLPALNIVGEKERGTIEQINVTPITRGNFILAKLIPYWVIALFVITVCFVLSATVYGITPRGNIILLYALAMLLALFFSGMGLVVSNASHTLQQAIFVMWFFVVIMMLLSGLFTPFRSMPHWAQTIGAINPAHYFIDAMRTVFVRGGGITSVWRQMAALAAGAIIMGMWAVKSYRKNG